SGTTQPPSGGTGSGSVVQPPATTNPIPPPSGTTQPPSGGTGSGSVVQLTVREGSLAPQVKNLTGAFASYSDQANYLRSFYINSSKSYTKAELTKQYDCPADCTANPSDPSCNPPPCTLGTYDVSWSFCAEEKMLMGDYTLCVAAAVGNGVEYPNLNLDQAVYPNKMGNELPYISYAMIRRCEKRSGDTANKFYNYTSALEAPKIGHHGSLDIVKFDPTVPTNFNNPLISFNLKGGHFVESAYPQPPNPLVFDADIEATNVPVVSIPACKPR
ncbi:MAG: hypothetical protein WCK43_08940, partial [bacterium]